MEIASLKQVSVQSEKETCILKSKCKQNSHPFFVLQMVMRKLQGFLKMELNRNSALMYSFVSALSTQLCALWGALL